MSGHSHWKTIQRTKQAHDKKRGEVFSKLSRLISVAAKDGGSDPGANHGLRSAIEKAKQFNMPKDNIEKAIKKGTGELECAQLEEFLFEAYGPGKTALIIEGITDNKNRSLAEIKQILNQYNGKLADTGSVQWLFEKKGVIGLRNTKEYEYTNEEREELELRVIEAGAEDIYWHNDILDVYTKPDELEQVKKNLEGQGIKIDSASLDWVAKDVVEVGEKDKQACEKLFEALDENDAVQEIYSNLKA